MKSIIHIEAAFAGVSLGCGISLRQAELVDDMSYSFDERWAQVRQLDVVHDWRLIPAVDLQSLCHLSHVDAEGFRYYLPALLILLVQDYDHSWPNVIQVFSALNPSGRFWEYSMQRYSLLSGDQKAAIAEFLSELPFRLELHPHDRKSVEESLNKYWGDFLSDKYIASKVPVPASVTPPAVAQPERTAVVSDLNVGQKYEKNNIHHVAPCREQHARKRSP